ncbi:hypothetical protein [Acinetobacter baumannii]|uniref:hypothetical protein n=1 Tax=Acinetobacter baumannii TaxID=470 RepID=UPI000BFA8159|nr:hypothetical protein [Acinetobacter baumannii]
MPTTNNEKVITIDCFPNDNIRRVTYRYGGLYRNGGSDTTNPLVEVLLIEIGENDQWLDLKKCSTFLVPLLDLDAVQQGSIWKGNLLTNEVYNFIGKLTTKQFKFDFTNHKPRNIKSIDKLPNTSEYYVPLKKIMLPQKNDYFIQGYPFNKYNPESYHKVNYCLMLSNDNIQVITSAVHILHSLFVNRKDIRGSLLSTPIQTIVNRYLDSYTTETIDDKTEYKIKIRKPYEDLGDTAIIFLANLALNKHVQNTVEKIQYSMEITDFSSLQNNNNARYPIVLPPHPTTLSVETEGIWLDEEKTRFFITRFKRVDPINDHLIDVNQDHINTVKKDDDQKPIPRERSKNKNEHINTQKPPSRVNGEYRKRSDVETGSTVGILKYSLNESENDPVKVDTNIQPYTDKSEAVETSSDQPYGNEKTNIKKSESADKPPVRDERFDIKYIIQSLENLVSKADSNLHYVYSVNESGQSISGFNLLQIKPLVPDPKHPSWIDSEIGRKLLFLKLELKDRNDHCYLIDIHKNRNHEAFCAFLILTTSKLTSEQIKKICIAIENTKGIKKWSQQCTSFTRQIIPIKHSCATPEEWANKFASLFSKLPK